MTTMNRSLAALLALAALLGLLAGCESDSVAPHDAIPAVTADDAAYQAGVVAYAVGRVGPYAVDAPAKATHTFTGEFGLTGTVFVEFAGGQSHMYTAEGAPLVYTTELGGQTMFDIDLVGTVNVQAQTVTLVEGSGGTVTSGDYVVAFTTTGLVLGMGYPDGVLMVTAGSHSGVVTFDGTNVATIVVDDNGQTWTVNLDTGAVTRPS